MMPRHRVQTLFIWLTVSVCVLLGWTIQREITALPSTRAAAPAAAPAADPVAPAAPASFAVPDRGSLAVIVERPVFSESRRPSVSDEGPAPTLDFMLVGVVISDRESSAIVQSSHGAVQRLAEGEEVNGWIVVDIAPDHIVVRHDATEAEMPLDYSAPAPPVPVANTPSPNGAKPNATKPVRDEPDGAEAQGILEGQPPEVLPPDDDDGDDEQQSTN